MTLEFECGLLLRFLRDARGGLDVFRDMTGGLQVTLFVEQLLKHVSNLIPFLIHSIRNLERLFNSPQ